MNRRLGKAGEYGTFEQALRIEDHVIRIGPQRISALPDFSPGGFAEQAFSPTARSYGNHRPYPGVQPRNVGKAFLNQPVDLQVRHMGVDVRDNRQVMNDISQ